jgi:hypothetical protein
LSAEAIGSPERALFPDVPIEVHLGPTQRVCLLAAGNPARDVDDTLSIYDPLGVGDKSPRSKEKWIAALEKWSGCGHANVARPHVAD